MNVNLTGIGPMLPFVKGRQGLEGFDLEKLWHHDDAPWFDPRTDLGGRGFKYYNDATRYMIAAVREFDDTKESEGEELADTKGVVIGSNSCTRKELDEFDQILMEHGANAINPMRAPSFCANVGTGNVSIKHKAKAFNITLMNPITAGLEAVILGKNAILGGRASTVIAGAMEDDAEFILCNGHTMRTMGGAWAMRLQADNSGNAAIAQLGPSLSRFIPAAEDVNGSAIGLANALGCDIAPLLRDVGNELPVYVAMLTDSHSRKVLSLLQGVLGDYGIGKDSIISPTSESQLGTQLSLAYLSWCALTHEQALCVAISPLGQIVAVKVMRPKEDKH